MAKAKKEEQTAEDQVAVEITAQPVTENNASDSKIILAPLAKYGVVAIFLASIIVTSAIVLNKQLNIVDDQVASVENDIAVLHAAEQLSATKNTENTDVISPEASMEETVAQINSPVAIQSADSTPVATEINTTVQPYTYQAESEPYFDRKARITERNKYLAQQDQEYLDGYKANQARQIELLREQLARQEERIQEIEKRNQETYQMRAAAIKRTQEFREQSLNRI